VYDSLMAAMYDGYSTKLTAAYYILDCKSIASSQMHVDVVIPRYTLVC